MASYNDITGNCLVTKPATEAYRNNFDAIFGKKKAAEAAPATTPLEDVLAKRPQEEIIAELKARSEINFPVETTAEEDEAFKALEADKK